MKVLAFVILSVLVFQSAADDQLKPKGCKELRADIFVVLDESSSIRTYQNFQKELSLVHELIDQVEVGPTKVQIGVMTFSTNARMKFRLDEHDNKEDLHNAVKAITWQGGDTYTNEAIDMLIDEGFKLGNGAREDVPKIAVIVSDGGSSRKSLTDAAVKRLKETKIIVFTVGVGPERDNFQKELQNMATIPEYSFPVEDLDELQTMRKELVEYICEAEEIEEEVPQKEEECKELRADIFVVLDESSSIHSFQNFEKELSLVRELVDQVEIGATKVQIGVMTFSTEARMKFLLNAHDSKTELIQAISAITWQGGDTYTDLAIDMLINEGFKIGNGVRQDVPKIALFVSDGRSTRPELTKEAVKKLKTTDINTFTVGVGPELAQFKTELMAIASDPANYFHVEDLDGLVNIRRELVQHICEGPQNIEECKETKADIMFILDGSSSIHSEQIFKKELNFITDVVDGLEIGPSNTQVGVIKFSDNAQLEINLNAFESKKELASAVHEIDWIGGNTFLDKAIDLLLKVMTPANGLRDGVPHIVVLISDGVSTDPYTTFEKIKKMREETDFIFIAIGVGPEKDMDELRKIATQPVDSHVFEVESQDALGGIRSKLLTVLCQGEKPAEKVCEGKEADIIFIADLSSSIGYGPFDQLKEFIENVVEKYTTGPENIQIGLITYSNEAKTEFRLNEYRDQDEIIKAIDKVTYTTGDTYTNLALEEMLTNGFTTAAGARDGVPKIAIVITDGESREPTETMRLAKEAKDANIIMFSIGVGPYQNPEELVAMASEPSEKHSFSVSDYAALVNIENSLASRACTAKQPNKRTENSRFNFLRRFNLNDRQIDFQKEKLARELEGLHGEDRKAQLKQTVRNTDNEKELLSILKKVLKENIEEVHN